MNTTTRQAKSKVKKGAAKTNKAVNTNARLARNKVKKVVAKTSKTTDDKQRLKLRRLQGKERDGSLSLIA